MGRPINKKFLSENSDFRISGTYNNDGQEVFVNVIEENGSEEYSIEGVLNQSFKVNNVKLFDGPNPDVNMLSIPINSPENVTEYARKITNTRVYTFQGNSYSWNIYNPDLNDATIGRFDWTQQMIESYKRIHTSQVAWFNTRVVDTIADRNQLVDSLEPESYVKVLDDGTGQSAEYILGPNKKYWVPIGIYNRAEITGPSAIEALYNRLSSGYLFDTFGPDGENRQVCDFVYLFYRVAGLGSIDWTKSGDTLRWDSGSNVVSFNGVPNLTYDGTNDEVITVSTTDSFSNITYLTFSNATQFKGPLPTIDLSSIDISLGNSQTFRVTDFCGKIPLMDFSSYTGADRVFSASWRFTSSPALDFSNVTSAIDTFYQVYSLGRVDKGINFESSENLIGTFRLTALDYIPEIIVGDSLTDISSCFANMGNLKKVTDNDLYWLKSKLATAGNIFNGCINLESSSVKFSALLSDYEFAANNYANCPNLNNTGFDFSKIITKSVNSDNFIANTLNIKYSQSEIDHLLKVMYKKRFDTKELIDIEAPVSETIVLSFGINSPSGIYRNSSIPKTGAEYLYKLVENPDSEDIARYVYIDDFENQPISDVYSTDINVNISDPADRTFRVSLASPVFNSGLTYTPMSANSAYIDWGDGNFSQINYAIEDYIYGLDNGSTHRNVTHEYATTGNYVIRVRSFIYINNFYDGFISTDRDKITELNIGLNYSNSMFRAFRQLTNLTNINFKNSFINSVWNREAFRQCTSLINIGEYYALGSSDTDANNMFNSTGSIESVKLLEMRHSFSIANNQLDDEALNELFDGLAVIDNGSATVTVTGNPGVGGPVYDPSIATDKGWTVVD